VQKPWVVHITRDFVITERSWWLDLGVYQDKDCRQGFFSARIQGPYRLLDFSTDVAGATRGNFSYASIQFTAQAGAAASLFDQAGCGGGSWVVGVPQEVGQTGCIGVAAKIADCPIDHDLVKLEGDQLFFGARETDMCKPEGRPKKLNVAPLVRR
jgi:hypothetical protein